MSTFAHPFYDLSADQRVFRGVVTADISLDARHLFFSVGDVSERLLGEMAGLAAAEPRRMVERIMAAVHAHAGGTPQSDDITPLALQYKGNDEPALLGGRWLLFLREPPQAAILCGPIDVSVARHIQRVGKDHRRIAAHGGVMAFNPLPVQ
jgi:hypothetical protein